MSENPRDQLDVLNQLIKELAGVYRDAMTVSKHSDNEFWIWYALIAMEGEYAQQDICGIWSLSKQTVNNIVTKMVSDGYITLEIEPGTRNRKIIRLTEAGRVYGEKLILPICRREERAFERLSAEERGACMVALRQYIENFKDELNGIEGSNGSFNEGM